MGWARLIAAFGLIKSFGSNSPPLRGRPAPLSQLLKGSSTQRSTHNDNGDNMTKLNLAKFELEKDRYRLYAAMSCPFAHRVRLVRLLHGLEDTIEITYVTGQTSESFTFDKPEPEFGAMTLREVYQKANPSYEGRATVPLVVDKTNQKIVNNESLEIAMALAAQCSNEKLNLLLPEGTEALCKDLNDKVTISVYKYLFTADSDAKQQIAQELWSELDKYNQVLESQPYLLGDKLSLADCVLWATVIRFDNVYARQFGLKGKTIQQDYPNLARFAERIWKLPSQKADTTLGEDASLIDIVKMYWISGNLAPKAGNDPTSPPPDLLPVF